MPIKEENAFVSEVRSIVQQMGSKKPAGSILVDPEMAAVISKLRRPREKVDTAITNPEGASATTAIGAQEISRSIMTRIEDNENVIKLFPDIELAEQIVISSILAPKDMASTELIYKLVDNRFPATLTNQLLVVLKEHVSRFYKLKEQCSDILSDAMFKKGSHVKAILPESAVDELINGGAIVATESIFSTDLFADRSGDKVRHLGLLGNAKPDQTARNFSSPKMVIESIRRGTGGDYDADVYSEDENIRKAMSGLVEVTDNFHLLKFHKLVEAVSAASVKQTTGSRLEKNSMSFVTESYKFFETKKAEGRISEEEMKTLLYRNNVSSYKPFVSLPTKDNLKRKSVGRPLAIDIPSEAAIPVYVPGTPDKHIAYFVPIDGEGNFVTVDSTFEGMQGMSSMLSQDRTSTGLSNLLTEKARKNLAASDEQPTLENITELYVDILEKDFIQRLSKGKYSRDLRVGRNNEIARIMLIRALKSQFTRVVLVPAEYVTYFAFRYHRNGVGKSYLDDLANISGLRAMVLFSKTMAQVKNSIETTHVNVKLDPRDHDPAGTLEKAKHLIAKTRQQFFPHGLNRVVDLTDWISRAGIQITFEGHPKMPTTSFDFETKNNTHPMPEDGLEEQFRYQTYMHFGLTPDAVDTAAKSDFATVIEKSSVLFSKRVAVWSDKFSEHLTDYHRKILLNDNELVDRLLETMEQSKADIESILTEEEKELYSTKPELYSNFLLYQFSNSLKVDLPKPEFTTLTNMNTSFTERVNAYKAAIEYVIDSNILPAELGGEASQYVDMLKNVWLAGLMRKWMAENNYVPEVMDISTLSDDGKPAIDLLELTENHSKNIMAAATNLLSKMRAAKAAVDNDIKNLGSPESTAESTSSSSNSGGGDSGGAGDDLMGSNMFSGEGTGDGTGDGAGEEGGEEGGDAVPNPFA